MKAKEKVRLIAAGLGVSEEEARRTYKANEHLFAGVNSEEGLTAALAGLTAAGEIESAPPAEDQVEGAKEESAKERLARLQAEIKDLRTKVKEEKATKTAAYTRTQSVIDILLAGDWTTKKDLVTAANNLYIEHGGKDNEKESAWAVGTALAPLTLLGLVVEVRMPGKTLLGMPVVPGESAGESESE